MQERNIMVANTEDQTRKAFKSTAETLGELKRDFDANGIHYEGLDITEGISKTQLLDDSSQLPTQVTYKGSKTNDLVILITRTKKKTASGAVNYERMSCYEGIKRNGLQQDVKDTFGKNFTQVSTDELEKFLRERGYRANPTDEELRTTLTETAPKDDLPQDLGEDKDDGMEDDGEGTPITLNPVASCYHIVRILANAGVLSADDVDNLITLLQILKLKIEVSKKELDEPVGDAGITNKDIDAMIASL